MIVRSDQPGLRQSVRGGFHRRGAPRERSSMRDEALSRMNVDDG